ncbi:FAST kinase domain-containing protein 4-like [Saccoglossus kowalevskii]|uniref:FAST kinase domain-containing protein 4 n=1 Tax=Saccoglossus kowalevskii TaxID=10224 RepID=A0ABM0LW28_SACKO|nr:PREDICTED: protein TBRG4-like [Saccoglossus kowalevskii]
MAAFILRRVNHNMIRTFSTCVPLGIRNASLRRPLAQVEPLSRMYARNLSVVPRVAKGQKKQNETQVGKEAYNKVNEASSAEDLLDVVSKHQLDGNVSAFAVSQLNRYCNNKEMSREDVRNDPRFEQLCQVIEQKVIYLSPSSLVASLRNLTYLGVKSGEHLIQSLELEIRFRLRKLSFQQLTSLAVFYVNFCKNESQQGLMDEINKMLELRWTEIDSAWTLLQLMERVAHSSPLLMEKLEDKALQMAESMESEDMSRVALALSKSNRRTLPLLRALAYHVLHRHKELGLQTMWNFTYAFAKLNFYHSQLMEKIQGELLQKVPDSTPYMIATFAWAFSYNKYLDKPLFDAMSQYIVSNISHFKQLRICSIIISYARLNYQPSGDFFEKLLTDFDFSALSSDKLVDVVWSLVILQQASAEFISHVLASQHLEKLPDGTSYQIQMTRQKLLHINTAAKLEQPDYTGPFLPDDFMKPADSLINPGRENESLSPSLNAVMQSLAKAIGGDKYIRTNVFTPYGYTIDAEFLVDSKLTPLPINDYKTFYLPEDDTKQEVPEDAYRIAVINWEYNKYCQNSKQLLGRYTMTKRHLIVTTTGKVTNTGKLVMSPLLVPYYEWNDLKSDWQKTAYIKEKLQKTVKSDA